MTERILKEEMLPSVAMAEVRKMDAMEYILLIGRLLGVLGFIIVVVIFGILPVYCRLFNRSLCKEIWKDSDDKLSLSEKKVTWKEISPLIDKIKEHDIAIETLIGMIKDLRGEVWELSQQVKLRSQMEGIRPFEGGDKVVFNSIEKAAEELKRLGFEPITVSENMLLLAKRTAGGESALIVAVEKKQEGAVASMQSLTKSDFEAIKEFMRW